MKKKHLFMPTFRQSIFIREVDIFLLIYRATLAENDEEKLGHMRLHGFIEDPTAQVYCACEHRQEKVEYIKDGHVIKGY